MGRTGNEVTDTEISPSAQVDTVTPPRAWVGYVVPMAVFIGLTVLEGQFPKYYPLLYILKALLVTACLIVFRAPMVDIRFDWRVLLPAVLVGALVFAEWVWLDKWIPYPHLGKRVAYNPFVEIPDPGMRALFLFTRFYGLALMVPVMEELFWRSFLLRYITEPDDFQRIPVGQFSWMAFGIVAVAFGVSHPEWLVAVICAAAYGLLLKQTRSLFACVVAHGVTNLMLGIYVITMHDWRFW